MRAEKKTPLLLFTHSFLLLFLSILKGLVIDSACFTLTHIPNFPMFYHDKVCSKFLLLVFFFFFFFGGGGGGGGLHKNSRALFSTFICVQSVTRSLQFNSNQIPRSCSVDDLK